MRTIKVVEIYSGIQGEGANAGIPSLFLRLYGCNLYCPFCDTKYAWSEFEEVEAEHLVEKILQEKGHSRLLVVTGGEPLLQSDALREVLAQIRGIEVEVETNGTINPIPLKPYVDYWSVSPKPDTEIHPSFFTMPNASFKFLFGGKKCEYKLVDIDSFVSEHRIDKSRVWVMPLASDRSTHNKVFAEAYKFALERGYNVTPRLHVLAHNKTGRGV